MPQSLDHFHFSGLFLLWSFSPLVSFSSGLFLPWSLSLLVSSSSSLFLLWFPVDMIQRYNFWAHISTQTFIPNQNQELREVSRTEGREEEEITAKGNLYSKTRTELNTKVKSQKTSQSLESLTIIVSKIVLSCGHFSREFHLPFGLNPARKHTSSERKRVTL